MIVIMLTGPHRENPDRDPLGRTRSGYSPGMSQEELYNAGRWAWRLGRRADSERYALFVAEGEGKMAIRIRALVDAGTYNGHPRRAIEGDVLRQGDPVHDTFVGHPSPVPPQRNPIRYLRTEFDQTSGLEAS
jgi:hypothetical protein